MTAAPRRSSVPAWWTVMRREFFVRITDKTFLLSTATMLLLIGAFLGLMAFNGNRESEMLRVGVTESSAVQIVEAADAGGDPSFETVDIGDAAGVRGGVEAEELDFGLVRTGDAWEIITRSAGENTNALNALRAGVSDSVVAQNAEAAGVDLAALTADADPEIVEVGAQGENGVWASALPLIFGLVFYMAVILFGTSIAQSVVAEKESRIVEILAASMSLRSLLLGKILATSLLAFLQITLFAGATVLGMRLMDISIEGTDLTTALLWFVPFFIVGFLGLACIWAAVGAVASRTEDLQATSLPLTLGLALVLFAPMILDKEWTEIMSFVPLFSSVLMPGRMFTGSAELWEGLLALGLGILFCAITLVLGDRMYRRSVMQTGTRVSWLAALGGSKR